MKNVIISLIEKNNSKDTTVYKTYEDSKFLVNRQGCTIYCSQTNKLLAHYRVYNDVAYAGE